ncbi:hypothetical protein ACFSLT_24920 [Novosphingobium resinovorum]
MTAFIASGGLGIGPGSFRSSSLFMAILGTMGVIGIGTFAWYLISVVRPIGATVAASGHEAMIAVMRACAVTAPIILIPAAVSSPTATRAPASRSSQAPRSASGG